jgi:hypothetical protein
MAEGIIKTAIESIKNKILPPSPAPTVFIPSEEYRSIYGFLEVWDKDRENPENQDKTRYIYDTLKEQGDPKTLIMDILLQLGETPLAESKIDRVYRYLRLSKDADRAGKYYELLQTQLKTIRGGK